MKTTLSIRSLNQLVISATLAASLNMTVLAQPKPDKNDMMQTYSGRLNNIVEQTDMKLKYVAPDDFTINAESDEALKQLDELTAGIEAGLKYEAPADYEDQSVQNLEILADAMMDDLKYRAPANDETLPHSLAMAKIKRSGKPVKVEVYRSMQDEWLINAGYYKSNRKSAWDGVKKALHSRSANRDYAIEY